jgi:multimeric flavodoxin WrbA
MKISIFNGSVRKNGNTASATSYLSSLLQEKATVNEYFLYHINIRGCLSCGTGTGKEKAMEMVNEMLSSDVIVHASPIYMGHPSDSVSSLLEVLYHTCRGNDDVQKEMDGKRTAFIITESGSESDTSGDHLQRICDETGMDVIDFVRLRFDDALTDAHREMLRSLAEKIVG